MYRHQTLIVILNFTKIINWFLKSDWLITMLFQGQQRCWLWNTSHSAISGCVKEREGRSAAVRCWYWQGGEERSRFINTLKFSLQFDWRNSSVQHPHPALTEKHRQNLQKGGILFLLWAHFHLKRFVKHLKQIWFGCAWFRPLLGKWHSYPRSQMP